jgi:predicted NUDIX family NTP pyrophosphohydrolase
VEQLHAGGTRRSLITVDRKGGVASEGVAKQSAGIVLYRERVGAPEVLLVHPGGPFWEKKDLGVWSIPKGEYEANEDPLACALREFEEELGVPPPTDTRNALGSTRQAGGKLVSAWAAEGDLDPTGVRSNTFTLEWPPRSGVIRKFPEVDRAEWFALAEARRRINPAQVVFLERLRELLKAYELSRSPRVRGAE